MSDQGEPKSKTIVNKTFNFFYTFPSDLSVHLANEFSVSSSAGHYYLDFFQLQPPIGSQELVVDVEQRCVARLAFTPEVLTRLSMELQRHHERHEGSQREVVNE